MLFVLTRVVRIKPETSTVGAQSMPAYDQSTANVAGIDSKSLIIIAF